MSRAPGGRGDEPGGTGAEVRWLAFDHPGSPAPVGLVRVLPGGQVEYLDRDGSWQVDPALTPDLLAPRTREVDASEAEVIARRLRAGPVS